jgi:hypothetical protein
LKCSAPCQIKLASLSAKAIKVTVLDRRYVTASDKCLSVVAGPLQARPILMQAQATLISLPPTCSSSTAVELLHWHVGLANSACA